ncbi:MAG TPA: hypothetical protein VHA52_05730, partial [Candidatus Babeliaceae bacterium]|nr:hypothetical protein [Candidatus Babeliaceae bacterium]
SKHVIDGWHRVLLWKQLGNTTIPCHFVTCNPIQERKLHLSLNVASAAFDLGDFGQEYGGIDLIEYGFTEADLQAKGLLLKEKFPSLNNRNGQEAESSSSYCKLMTNLPTTTFEDLQTIKKEIQARSIANTIIYLVKNYYEKDSRN